MPTIGDLRNELDESVDLTGDVISDTNILLNILLPVQTIVGSIRLYQAQQNLLFDYLNTTEKVLVVASKLPIVGGPLNAVRFVAKHFNDTLEHVDDTLKVVDAPIKAIDNGLTGLSAPLTAANLMANGALAVNSSRIEVLGRLDDNGLIDNTTELSGDGLSNYTQLAQANDITRQVVEFTQPMRDELGALDFSAFGVMSDLLLQATGVLEDVNSAFGRFEVALDALDKAIEPVEWALDEAGSVIDKVVNPVIEAVLDATGLDQVIEDVSDLLFDQLGVLDDLNYAIERVRVEIENNDVVRLVNDFWDDFGALFDPGGGIDLAATLSVITIDNGDGSLNVIGTDGDDTLLGGAGDDNFAPLRGNDSVDGAGGTDRVFFLGLLEDYRVEFVTDTGGRELIQVSPRAEATADEGTDLLRNVELLRFTNPLIGDITRDDISRFHYTDPGTPNLTGTEDKDFLFGDDAANYLDGAGGGDLLFGGRGDDFLSGGDGDDLLFGGDGDDLLIGGAGGDTVHGEAGNDDIVFGIASGDTALDSVDGGAGHDALFIDGNRPITADFATGAIDFGASGVMAFANVEEIVSGRGDDLFLGGMGAETVYGGGGDDSFLYAGAGDVIYGLPDGRADDGIFRVSYAGGGFDGVRVEALVREDPGYSVVTGVNELTGFDPGTAPSDLANPALLGVEVVDGTERADTFYALGVTQGAVGTTRSFTFTHGGESFTIDGSVFFGGAGTDVFFASEKESFFDGGEGYDLVNFNLDYTIADRLSDGGVQSYTINLQTGLATGLRNEGIDKSDIHLRNIEGVVGTRGDDVIIGNDAANYLFGYTGHDTIMGGGGADYIDASGLIGADLRGGAGNDVFALGPAEDATVDGGAGSDALELVPDQAFRLDVHYDEEARGEEDSDLVNVSGWNVDLAAGTASSTFERESPRPGDSPFERTAHLRSIENVLGSNFDDTLAGNGDDNLLLGRDGDDQLEGRGGDDALRGDAGDDSLLGGAGDDFLDGGAGADILNAQDGDDRIHAGSGDDVIGGAGNDTISVFRTDVDGEALVVDGGAGEDELRVDRSASVDDFGNGFGFVSWEDGTNLVYSGIEKVTVVPCFTPGTRIATARGERAVEDLRVGDRVLTRDNGYRVIRWIGRRELSGAELAAHPALWPVRIAAGALGQEAPMREMLVSPQHRVLIRDAQAELLFGEREVLVKARHLVGRPGIEVMHRPASVTYVHLLFDEHELVLSDGIWTESFQPGALTVSALDEEARAELRLLFPELFSGDRKNVPISARPSLKRHEAELWAEHADGR